MQKIHGNQANRHATSRSYEENFLNFLASKQEFIPIDNHAVFVQFVKEIVYVWLEQRQENASPDLLCLLVVPGVLTFEAKWKNFYVSVGPPIYCGYGQGKKLNHRTHSIFTVLFVSISSASIASSSDQICNGLEGKSSS
ncbi:unnamed protein product [Caenorhabditis nigoni]